MYSMMSLWPLLEVGNTEVEPDELPSKPLAARCKPTCAADLQLGTGGLHEMVNWRFHLEAVVVPVVLIDWRSALNIHCMRGNYRVFIDSSYILNRDIYGSIHLWVWPSKPVNLATGQNRCVRNHMSVMWWQHNSAFDAISLFPLESLIILDLCGCRLWWHHLSSTLSCVLNNTQGWWVLQWT